MKTNVELLKESFVTDTLVDVVVGEEKLRLVPVSLDRGDRKNIFKGETVQGRPYLFDVQKIEQVLLTGETIPATKISSPIYQTNKLAFVSEKVEPVDTESSVLPPVTVDSSLIPVSTSGVEVPAVVLEKQTYDPKPATEQIDKIESLNLVPVSKTWQPVLGATAGAVALLGAIIFIGYMIINSPL